MRSALVAAEAVVVRCAPLIAIAPRRRRRHGEGRSPRIERRHRQTSSPRLVDLTPTRLVSILHPVMTTTIGPSDDRRAPTRRQSSAARFGSCCCSSLVACCPPPAVLPLAADARRHRRRRATRATAASDECKKRETCRRLSRAFWWATSIQTSMWMSAATSAALAVGTAVGVSSLSDSIVTRASVRAHRMVMKAGERAIDRYQQAALVTPCALAAGEMRRQAAGRTASVETRMFGLVRPASDDRRRRRRRGSGRRARARGRRRVHSIVAAIVSHAPLRLFAQSAAPHAHRDPRRFSGRSTRCYRRVVGRRRRLSSSVVARSSSS